MKNITKLQVNSNDITDDKEINSTFNQYFCAVGENLVRKLNEDNGLNFIKSYKQYLCNPLKSQCSVSQLRVMNLQN